MPWIVFLGAMRGYVPRGTLATEIDQQDGNVSRRNAGDTGGLGNGARTITLELDPAFHGKRCQTLKIEVLRDCEIFKTQNFLRQTALAIKGALLFEPGVVVTSVPYHLR